MNHDYDAVRIHRAELDHEIDAIREERLLAAGLGHAGREGLIGRTRQLTGRALIAAGTALVGREQGTFRTRRV
jgi:hypothetical protein